MQAYSREDEMDWSKSLKKIALAGVTRGSIYVSRDQALLLYFTLVSEAVKKPQSRRLVRKR